MISSYFPPGRVTWPLLGWERGGQNASMKTTWREERAATKQKERESERERPTWATETDQEEQQSSCKKIWASRTRTKIRSRTRIRGCTQQPEPVSGPQTRSSPVHHVRVHQKEKLQQTAPAEPHQVRGKGFKHMTISGLFSTRVCRMKLAIF